MSDPGGSHIREVNPNPPPPAPPEFVDLEPFVPEPADPAVENRDKD